LPSLSDPPRQSAEQQALYAFEATDGTIKLGVWEEVGKWLRDRLVELSAAPFVLYDVAEFLGDSSLIIQAQERCNALVLQRQMAPDDWTEAWERVVRLENPVLEKEFQANLFWMVERGNDDNLKLLQRLRTNPPFTSYVILRLLDLAIQRIHDRTGTV
jgi:hypothetical protein